MTLVDTKATKGARSITAQLKKAIRSGALADGDQLPPERELSETYEASRSTVRKALDQLESEGLVFRKVGSGTYVSYSGIGDIDVENVIDEISPLQLIDARMGFERQMARLAVVHSTARDIERMESVLKQLVESENDRDKFTQLDSEFHLLLAKASGNPLIVRLYDQINEVRTHSQWKTAREIVLTPAKMREYNKHHKRIVNALRLRDAATAIDALNDHMALAHADLMGTPDEV